MAGWDGESEKPERGPAEKTAPPANRVAERILEANRLVTDATGTTYIYDAGPWRALPEIMLHSMALAADGQRHTSQRRRGEIVSFIRASSHDSGLEWGRVQPHELACRNGILDVREFRLRPHEPDNYLERVLPWDWQPGAACPAWHDFLDDCFGDDGAGGEAAALQQFFGYIAMSHARYKKALLLQGPTDTGKSVVEKVAVLLVGKEASCTLSVEDMDDPGRRSVIKGMALNTMTELPAHAMIADSGFKQMVSTEDAVLLDDKYKLRERYVPHAKHLIACNHLPALNDKTEAMFNRLLLVPLRRQVAKARQDPDLPDRLAAEMPGVLAWAAAGARALDAAHGRWPEIPAAADILQQYRDDTNPVGAFLRECCEPDNQWAHSLQDLNKAFNDLGYSGGRRTNVRGFGALVRAHLGEFAVKDVKFRRTSGDRAMTLKALPGYRLEQHSLPRGCALPAGAMMTTAREIDAADPPPDPPDVE